jgi:hypothetical protein
VSPITWPAEPADASSRPPVSGSVGQDAVAVAVLPCVTVVVLELLLDAGPVVTEAVPLALLVEVAVLVPPAVPTVCVVVLPWPMLFDAELSPLFEDADWRVVTRADWSTSFTAAGMSSGLLPVAVAVAALVWPTVVPAVLLVVAPPAAITAAAVGTVLPDVPVLAHGGAKDAQVWVVVLP